MVQIRGSIPLLWTMKPNLKWSPPVKINQNFHMFSNNAFDERWDLQSSGAGAPGPGGAAGPDG